MRPNNPTVRRVMIIASLLLVILGLLAVGYVLWPPESSQVIATLAPTVFAPP